MRNKLEDTIDFLLYGSLILAVSLGGCYAHYKIGQTDKYLDRNGIIYSTNNVRSYKK